MFNILFKMMRQNFVKLVILLLNFSIVVLSTRESTEVPTAENRNMDDVLFAVQKLISVAQNVEADKFVTSRPTNCADLQWQGYTKSGIYTIYPKPWFGVSNMSVYCDMATDGGGWTVFQRRADFEPRQNFIQDWDNYRKGFGQLDREFWLGNDNLYILTNQDYVTLRVDLEDFDNDSRLAVYDDFKISNCQDRYRFKVGKFNGNVGDDLTPHNNRTFVTYDDGDINNCARNAKGGWWYTNCFNSNLNAIYLKGPTEIKYQGVIWHSFRGHNYSLKKSEMKFRPTHFVPRKI